MSAEEGRRRYRICANGAFRKAPASKVATRWFANVCLALDVESIRLDLAVAQAHRVTGGPHPRLLGLTDGPALAVEAGIAWA